MLPKQPMIEDIQTTDLIYYDPEFNEICFTFCKERDIDYLPSFQDSKKAFRRYKGGFQEIDVPAEMCIDSRTDLFDPEVEERFNKQPLLFVQNRYQLSGVVHFSDYNRPIVQTYLFNLISAYERSLRELLCLKEKKNEHMRTYYESKVDSPTQYREGFFRDKIASYDKLLSRMKREKPFECFELADLIGLAREEKVIDLEAGTYDLRNDVMHGHHLIRFRDPYRNDYIYTIKSFREFFGRVTILQRDFKRVINRIALNNPRGLNAPGN